MHTFFISPAYCVPKMTISLLLRLMSTLTSEVMKEVNLFAGKEPERQQQRGHEAHEESNVQNSYMSRKDHTTTERRETEKVHKGQLQEVAQHKHVYKK